MNSLRRLWLKVLVLALLLGTVLGFVSLTTFGYRVETLALVSWFKLRYQLFGPLQVDSRLVVVGVDDPTIEYWAKPMLFWQAELAQLVGKIREDEPSVVGLDLLVAPATDGLDSESPVLQQIQNEGLELGIATTESPPLVLIEVKSEDASSQQAINTVGSTAPHETVLNFLYDEQGDTERLGVANVPTDPDGVVRRGKLYFRTLNRTNTPSLVNFSFKLLEQATGKNVKHHSVGDGSPQVSWDEREIPFLFDQSFLLNYPGPLKEQQQGTQSGERTPTFPIISARTILEGQVPPETFRDKIVVIAATSTSLGDKKVIPGDPDYFGVGQHLTIVNMFLTDQFLSRTGLLWVLVCALTAAVGMKLGRRARLVPVVALCVSIPILSFLAFVGLGTWLPAVFPFLGALGSVLLGYAERLFTVEKDRAIVRSTFGRMVSPQVMNHVLENHKNLRSGERKELTVLFSDINDFTPICEQHTPEEVIDMLSEYFSKMVDVIMKYDGYLKQYVGDEIMVIFGAPDDSDDHATRAVLTALEMRDALTEMRETAKGKPGFYEVKIGVNTGSVVVGKVGPESRWEYAAVGDHVNLGARVMSVAKGLGMDIGISAASKERYDLEKKEYSRFPDKVKWTSVGIQKFKGKVSQMEVFGIEKEE